ncbi:hypothetical protein FN846DRAFT_943292 [Sphaerosporella brunnea]|uniref:Uncharacterized protein n=1 Tax=Sphaerosporella brunnea TaxID=1250544 RepID=A0A5J5F0H9_9PEZI|nr:hypothetical protein FN846DRAFT_943292 [Sphaerosporella brunnea]
MAELRSFLPETAPPPAVVPSPLRDLYTTWSPLFYGSALNDLELQKVVDALEAHLETSEVIFPYFPSIFIEPAACAWYDSLPAGFTPHYLLKKLSGYLPQGRVGRPPTTTANQKPDTTEQKVASLRHSLHKTRKQAQELLISTSPMRPVRPTLRVFRITSLTTAVSLRSPSASDSDSDSEQVVRRNYDGFTGVFVTVAKDATLQAVEKEFLDTVKEIDPVNVGVLAKVKKVVFTEAKTGVVVRERGWEGVREIVGDLVAELVF